MMGKERRAHMLEGLGEWRPLDDYKHELVQYLLENGPDEDGLAERFGIYDNCAVLIDAPPERVTRGLLATGNYRWGRVIDQDHHMLKYKAGTVDVVLSRDIKKDLMTGWGFLRDKKVLEHCEVQGAYRTGAKLHWDADRQTRRLKRAGVMVRVLGDFIEFAEDNDLGLCLPQAAGFYTPEDTSKIVYREPELVGA